MTADSVVLFERILARVNGPIGQVLQPLAVAEKHEQLTRGGYPANSMPEGSRSSETPLPVTQPVSARDTDGNPTAWYPPAPTDRVDRDLRRRARTYTLHLQAALRELDAAFLVQTWYLETLKPDKDIYPCTNAPCPNLHERENAACDRCRQWKHRHGTVWAPKARTA